jgi:TRAP-type C4-dicarboxylate transport system permease small subunit
MNTTIKEIVLRSESYGMALTGTLHNVNMWLALPALIAVVTADVVVRFGFNSSIQGATEIGGLLLLMVFMLSLPFCTMRHGHVYMELVHVRLRGAWRWAADLIAVLSGLVFTALFTWQAFDALRDMIKYGDGGFLVDIPYWPFAGIVFVCGLFTALAFVLQLLKLLAGLAVNREEFANE